MNLVAVDECAVRRAEILDRDAGLSEQQPCVASGRKLIMEQESVRFTAEFELGLERTLGAHIRAFDHLHDESRHAREDNGSRADCRALRAVTGDKKCFGPH
jgi:hypothetical protein